MLNKICSQHGSEDEGTAGADAAVPHDQSAHAGVEVDVGTEIKAQVPSGEDGWFCFRLIHFQMCYLSSGFVPSIGFSPKGSKKNDRKVSFLNIPFINF